MRIATNTANKTTSQISGAMRFNLSSFAKLCSLLVIVLKCGAYCVLCTVVWKKFSHCPHADQVHQKEKSSYGIEMLVLDFWAFSKQFRSNLILKEVHGGGFKDLKMYKSMNSAA